MTPTSIILHHSLTEDGQTVSWGAIRRYHMVDCGWSDIGYHFGIELVGRDYEVFVGRMMTDIGAHTIGKNDSSIGICFVGNFDAQPPPRKQWDLGLRLVKSLCEVFNIQQTLVYSHRRFAPHKSCPGRMFDVKEFIEQL